MKRFFFSDHAVQDMDQISRYIDRLPKGPAHRRAVSLQQILFNVAAHPHDGAPDRFATRLLGDEVRTQYKSPYRVYYRAWNGSSEILAVIHDAQDAERILIERLA